MLVVPTLTRHDLLVRMLRSVDVPVGHLVVIDNSGIGPYVPPGPWGGQVTVLRMPANLGVAASWNLGIKLAHRHPWVLVCSDDVVWPAGTLQQFASMSDEARLVVTATWPHWCAFSIGMRVVQQVGLFDEGYFPAYYEDTEYERRMDGLGVSRTTGPAVQHDNASTLLTPGKQWNRDTALARNKALYVSGEQGRFDPYAWREQAWN